MIPKSICMPNVVAVRRPCRKGEGTDIHTQIVLGPDNNLVPPRGTKAHMGFLIGLCM